MVLKLLLRVVIVVAMVLVIAATKPSKEAESTLLTE
jgi:hypothetical protein